MSKQQESDPPLQLRVRDLETDMVIAKPVYTRDGCTLLPEGKQLTTQDIDRLNRWNQRYVYVKREEIQADTSANGFVEA